LSKAVAVIPISNKRENTRGRHYVGDVIHNFLCRSSNFCDDECTNAGLAIVIIINANEHAGEWLMLVTDRHAFATCQQLIFVFAVFAQVGDFT